MSIIISLIHFKKQPKTLLFQGILNQFHIIVWLLTLAIDAWLLCLHFVGKIKCSSIASSIKLWNLLIRWDWVFARNWFLELILDLAPLSRHVVALILVGHQEIVQIARDVLVRISLLHVQWAIGFIAITMRLLPSFVLIFLVVVVIVICVHYVLLIILRLLTKLFHLSDSLIH